MIHRDDPHKIRVGFPELWVKSGEVEAGLLVDGACVRAAVQAAKSTCMSPKGCV